MSDEEKPRPKKGRHLIGLECTVIFDGESWHGKIRQYNYGPDNYSIFFTKDGKTCRVPLEDIIFSR